MLVPAIEIMFYTSSIPPLLEAFKPTSASLVLEASAPEHLQTAHV
jgi:hypothetical protein